MKVLFAVGILIGSLISGCDQTNKVLQDDGKPVAPETYQEGKVEKTDPQLPEMIPHWKEPKK